MHPWRYSIDKKQKLAEARKQRDKRYQRDWHRKDRAEKKSAPKVTIPE